VPRPKRGRARPWLRPAGESKSKDAFPTTSPGCLFFPPSKKKWRRGLRSFSTACRANSIAARPAASRAPRGPRRLGGRECLFAHSRDNQARVGATMDRGEGSSREPARRGLGRSTGRQTPAPARGRNMGPWRRSPALSPRPARRPAPQGAPRRRPSPSPRAPSAVPCFGRLRRWRRPLSAPARQSPSRPPRVGPGGGRSRRPPARLTSPRPAAAPLITIDRSGRKCPIPDHPARASRIGGTSPALGQSPCLATDSRPATATSRPGAAQVTRTVRPFRASLRDRLVVRRPRRRY